MRFKWKPDGSLLPATARFAGFKMPDVPFDEMVLIKTGWLQHKESNCLFDGSGDKVAPKDWDAVWVEVRSDKASRGLWMAWYKDPPHRRQASDKALSMFPVQSAVLKRAAPGLWWAGESCALPPAAWRREPALRTQASMSVSWAARESIEPAHVAFPHAPHCHKSHAHGPTATARSASDEGRVRTAQTVRRGSCWLAEGPRVARHRLSPSRD